MSEVPDGGLGVPKFYLRLVVVRGSMVREIPMFLVDGGAVIGEVETIGGAVMMEGLLTLWLRLAVAFL